MRRGDKGGPRGGQHVWRTAGVRSATLHVFGTLVRRRDKVTEKQSANCHLPSFFTVDLTGAPTANRQTTTTIEVDLQGQCRDYGQRVKKSFHDTES